MATDDCEADRQLDDVGVAESTHVLDFTLNTIFGACHINDVF